MPKPGYKSVTVSERVYNKFFKVYQEKARRSGMTKGTAGTADTGSEYEQGAAGSNK